MITDRDICIAAATRSTSPANIRVGEVSTRELYSCFREDDVQTALKTMKTHRVRRLPVVDRQQRLVGIVSLNDLALRAECRQGADVPGEAFLDTMKSICAHTSPALGPWAEDVRKSVAPRADRPVGCGATEPPFLGPLCGPQNEDAVFLTA